MNAGQLIKALSKFNPRAKVLIAAESTGYHEVGSVERVQVVLRAQEDTGWDGPHVDTDSSVLENSSVDLNQAKMGLWLRPAYKQAE